MNKWRCSACDKIIERPDYQPPGQSTIDPRHRIGEHPKSLGGCGKGVAWVLMPPVVESGQARHSDPDTSKEAAARVRTGTTKMALLLAHRANPEGLTDEEAASEARLSMVSEYATRCSELMRAGYLEDTTRTRVGSSGMSRLVRVITPAGLEACE